MISKLALVSLVGCLCIAAPSPARRIDGGYPVIPLACDANPVAGELMLVTMPFPSAASTGGVVVVTSLTSGNFDSLLSAASYNAGDTSVSFYVQIDPNASGAIQLTVASSFEVGYMLEPLQTPVSTPSSIMASVRF